MNNVMRYQKILAAACCAIFTLALSSATAYADDAVTAQNDGDLATAQERVQTKQASTEQDVNQYNFRNSASELDTQSNKSEKAFDNTQSARAANDDLEYNLTPHWTDDGMYATDVDGSLVTSTWLTDREGCWYYMGADGWAASGLCYIEATESMPTGYFYFDINTFRQQEGIIFWTDGTRSYFDPNNSGAMAYSRWISWRGKKSYIDESGFTVKYLQTINGNKYYFNSRTEMQTGVIKWKSNGKISYFDPRQGGKASVNRWISWHGKKYYLDRNGYSVRYLNSIRGSKYYFNSACQMQTGAVIWKSTGKISYFDPRQGGKMSKNRWISYHGTKYYLDKNGYSTKRVR